MKIAACVAAFVAAGFSTSAALAQGASGFYVRGGGGAVLGPDLTFTDVDPNASNAVLGPGGKLNATTDTAAIVVGGIGYKFSPVFWADVTGFWIPELNVKNGSTTGVSATTGTPLISMSGKADTVGGMLNGYVDVARLFGLQISSLQPYVMGGAGIARNHIGTLSGTVPFSVVSGVSFTGSTHTDFAWGAGAGIGIPLSRNLAVDIAYEYLDLGELRTSGTGTLTLTAGSPITASAGGMKANLQVHTLQVSLRFGF